MIAAVYIFLYQADCILLSRRFQTGYEDGNYSVPAGHVEEGETLTAALIRETKEEIGVTILPDTVTLAHVMHRKKEDIRLDFFFTATHFSGTPTNCEPHKCDHLAWFPLSRLPSNTIPYIRSAINAVRIHRMYHEFGWNKYDDIL